MTTSRDRRRDICVVLLAAAPGDDLDDLIVTLASRASHLCVVGADRSPRNDVSGCVFEFIAVIDDAGAGAGFARGGHQALRTPASMVMFVDAAARPDPQTLDQLLDVVASGRADVCKTSCAGGADLLAGIPVAGLLRHMLDSFCSKLSSGYWSIGDSSFHACVINRRTLAQLLDCGFARGAFFGADILHCLYLLRAVVRELPGTGAGNAAVKSAAIGRLVPFAFGHVRNFARRVLGWYFVRHFQPVSIAWILGPLLTGYGVSFGLDTWRVSLMTGLHATAGQVMNAALPTLIGLQLVLWVLRFDQSQEPDRQRENAGEPLP